jgi:hypothetical protein
MLKILITDYSTFSIHKNEAYQQVQSVDHPVLLLGTSAGHMLSL